MFCGTFLDNHFLTSHVETRKCIHGLKRAQEGEEFGYYLQLSTSRLGAFKPS